MATTKKSTAPKPQPAEEEVVEKVAEVKPLPPLHELNKAAVEAYNEQKAGRKAKK